MLCTVSNSDATWPSFSARTDVRSSASSVAGAARSTPAAGGEPALELGDARVGRRAGVDVAREDDGRGRGATDHRRERALDREHRHARVERLGEDDERATVVAGDDGEDDRPVEVDDGPADLGAVLELEAAHRLG